MESRVIARTAGAFGAVIRVRAVGRLASCPSGLQEQCGTEATTCSSRRRREVRERQEDGDDAGSLAGFTSTMPGLVATTSIESTMSRIWCKVIAGVVECRSRTGWSGPCAPREPRVSPRHAVSAMTNSCQSMPCCDQFEAGKPALICGNAGAACGNRNHDLRITRTPSHYSQGSTSTHSTPHSSRSTQRPGRT
jgi:hypothetical protein